MPSGAQFQPLKDNDDDDDGGGGDEGSIYDAKAVEGKSKKQIRWRNMLLAMFAADIVCTAALYETTHGWGARWHFANGLGFSDDTLDLFALAIFRVVSLGLLVPATLAIGIDRVPPGKLPHQQTDAELARTERTGKIRPVMLIFMFLLGAISSVYSGIKVIMFDWASVEREGISPDFEMAPFLLVSIAVVNLQYSAIKRLVQSYVLRVGLIETPLHLHPLKFYSKGPPNTRRWGNNKKCDICRENQTKKPTYTCADCNVNICVMCFETKSATTTNGAETENVVRTEKGRSEKLELTTWSYFKRILGLAKGESLFVVLALSCLLLSSCAGLMQPNLQGRIFDSMYALESSVFKDTMQLYIFFQVINVAFRVLRQIFMSIVDRRVRYRVRTILFTSIIRQDVVFFDGMSTGQLTNRLADDAMQMLSPLGWALTHLLESSISLVGGLVMCLYTDWKLSILAFTSIYPVIVITQTYAIWSSQLWQVIQVARGDAMAAATEAFQNIRTVRAFSAEKLEEANYDKNTRKALRYGLMEAFGGALQGLLSQYTNVATGILILWYGGLVVLSAGSLTVGQLLAFQLYWNMMRGAFNGLNDVVVQFTIARGAAQRVFEMLDSMPTVDLDAGIVLKKEEIHGTFVLENVQFVYQMRPNEKVLDGIDLRIEGGTTVAFVGKSGGGKSTLIHLLMHFYTPTGGQITLDGMRLSDINLRSLHMNTGLVAQDTQLFGKNIEENIAYGLEKDSYTEEDLRIAAEKANAWEFIEKFQHGFQTRVGEKGVRLSGGQRQRIAIARVMLRMPRILFLDEATSALDTQSEALVQGALDTLIQTKDSTICLVAHRLSTVRDASTICVLGDGKIQESGTHDELMSNDGPYAKLVSRQITKESNEILGDGAFDAEKKLGEEVEAWLKDAPEALRKSPKFKAVREAAG